MSTIQLLFPAKSVYVGVARLAVAGIARAAGFDEETVFDLKAAVSEALSTAVLNGGEGRDSPVSISWEESAGSVVIEVRHEGGHEDPAKSEAGAERREMSVALLRALLHECEFISGDDGSTTIRLTLRR